MTRKRAAMKDGFNSPQNKSEELKPMIDISDVAERTPSNHSRGQDARQGELAQYTNLNFVFHSTKREIDARVTVLFIL
jgi:hypothetical protein